MLARNATNRPGSREQQFELDRGVAGGHMRTMLLIAVHARRCDRQFQAAVDGLFRSAAGERTEAGWVTLRARLADRDLALPGEEWMDGSCIRLLFGQAGAARSVGGSGRSSAP
jgi:hypothetical protein